MILIKLGGSIITNKEKPLSARKKTIENLAKSLKKIKEPIIIVHGGGSYGHYWSVKYDMHTKERKYNIRGVSIVKNSMIELNKIILDSMLKNKLNPYCLPPTDFMAGNKPIAKKIKEIEKIAKTGLIPVTYGDALWYGQKKTYILSGDKIMTHLAKILKPRLCIFALNEDGLYSDLKSKKLIYELQGEKATISDNKMDVTGGMTRKVEEAAKISKMGLNVFFTNGSKPERIVKAVKNKVFEGTLFRGKKMSEEFVILVDEKDNPIGSEEKVKCHLPNGKLHRAFTALLFDNKGRLVLTRRAKEKMLWPNDWDGTFASHPRESETYVSSGERRMPEELGISGSLDYLHKFEYHVPYKDVGSENEICGTLIGVIDESVKLKEIEGEIDEIKCISAKELLEELKKNPEIYCPWMLIALELLDKSDKSMLEKHANILSTWMNSEVHDELQKAIKIHLPENKWRLVNEEN